MDRVPGTGYGAKVLHNTQGSIALKSLFDNFANVIFNLRLVIDEDMIFC
jgi:hypothetical protein